jgi:hypothetical protein
MDISGHTCESSSVRNSNLEDHRMDARNAQHPGACSDVITKGVLGPPGPLWCSSRRSGLQAKFSSTSGRLRVVYCSIFRYHLGSLGASQASRYRHEFEHIQRLDGGVLLISDVTVYEPSIHYRCLLNLDSQRVILEPPRFHKWLCVFESRSG